MSQLSAQSIRKLCRHTKWFGLAKQQPMIEPFFATKRISESGRSFGLSAATYDVRIDHDLVLGTIGKQTKDAPPYFALANAMEDFYLPHNVVAQVIDKSSIARLFVSAFNTFIDPGFNGNLTLELVNLGDEIVEFKAGEPICQVAFHWLDKNTILPYSGKYQFQPKRPIGTRTESLSGDFIESNYGKRASTNRNSPDEPL